MKYPIYIVGNPLLPYDNIPLQILPKLRKKFSHITFTVLDPNENIKPLNKTLFIIDSATGIEHVEVINNLQQLQQRQTLYSLHDFDLATNLLLLEKLGALQAITIYCIPQHMKPEKAFTELVTQLERITIKI